MNFSREGCEIIGGNEIWLDMNFISQAPHRKDEFVWGNFLPLTITTFGGHQLFPEDSVNRTRMESRRKPLIGAGLGKELLSLMDRLFPFLGIDPKPCRKVFHFPHREKSYEKLLFIYVFILFCFIIIIFSLSLFSFGSLFVRNLFMVELSFMTF